MADAQLVTGQGMNILSDLICSLGLQLPDKDRVTALPKWGLTEEQGPSFFFCGGRLGQSSNA